MKEIKTYDELIHFLVLAGFTKHTECADNENYYYVILNNNFYELFFNKNYILLNITEVDDYGNEVSDALTSNYSFDAIVKILQTKFNGVIRQNKITKLLNNK